MRIQRVRGIPDWLGADAARLRLLEEQGIGLARQYGYQEVVLPVLEPKELFVRSIGTHTDIVGKEMYCFEDRGGEAICLRPEGTAGAVRAFLQAGLHRGGTQRWCYVGPMFRRERPQKGRLRQFTQFGCECFGLASPAADVELLALAWRYLDALGVAARVRLLLNSLGCSVCRPPYREQLVAFLEARRERLCADCQARITRNPMRVLDCKNASCQAELQSAPHMLDMLCDACRAHFAEVRAGLEALGIAYRVDPKIVRGLDYYTRTAFEFVAEGLGAQATVLAGGRYDGLVKALGGPDVPAVGFAAGLERLALLLDEAPLAAPDAVVIALGEEMLAPSLKVAEALRREGFFVVHAGGGGAKRQFREADRQGARWAVIIGEDEWKRGLVRVKDLQTGTQHELDLEEACKLLRTD